jgi:hypothetical protein
VDDYLAIPLGLVGTVEEIVADLLHRRDEYGITYVTVRAAHLEEFAPIVERLASA